MKSIVHKDIFALVQSLKRSTFPAFAHRSLTVRSACVHRPFTVRSPFTVLRSPFSVRSRSSFTNRSSFAHRSLIVLKAFSHFHSELQRERVVLKGPVTLQCFSVCRRVKNSSNTSMCAEYVLRTFFTC